MLWIYDGTIPFRYLKTVVAMQDSPLRNLEAPKLGVRLFF